MTLDQIKKFHECCKTIVRELRSAHGNLSSYAVSYAKEGLQMDLPDYIQDQIPYILSNLKHVRNNSIINQAKATLKELHHG